jgi:L-alanine-DL-glutamate epimerase-like enolase superfamily enzyme
MDRGLREMLIGRDPLGPVATWNDLCVGSAMSGRRGAVVHAIGALDIALWDISGKAAGKPLVFENGCLRPPARPGLGVELNGDALEFFENAAREFLG